MNDKVLLAVLEERQSAKGTRYLAGWLGKARLVGFLDKDAPDGKTQWQVYAQSPEDRGERASRGDRTSDGGGQGRDGHRYQRAAPSGQRQPPAVTGQFEDDRPF